MLAGTFAVLLVVFLLTRKSTDSGAAEAGEKGEARKEATDSIVTLDTAGIRLAELQIATVVSAGAGGLVANGAITYDANHVSVVAPRVEGRLTELRADLGQAVTAGTVLAVVDSRDVAQTRGEVERARAALDVAQNNYEREKRLYDQKISSQKEMLEAQGAYKTSLAEYNGAVAQISGIGAGPGEGGTYGLTSPLTGVVVERTAMPGQIVGPSTNLFTVADLRHVWITVDVYESDLTRVRPGATVVVSPRALPGESFRGRVTFAGGVIDTSSRTLKVRVEVDNAALRLRPGMFAQVRIETPAGSRRVLGDAADVALVPELAVQDLNGRKVVFVPAGAPGRFVARAVIVGPRAGSGLIAITAGLKPGDIVVTNGAFKLKSELIKGSFGEDEK